MESRNSRDAKASRQPGGWEQRHLRGTLADLEQGPKGQQEQKRGAHVSGELPQARDEEGVTLDGKERAIARDSTGNEKNSKNFPGIIARPPL